MARAEDIRASPQLSGAQQEAQRTRQRLIYPNPGNPTDGGQPNNRTKKEVITRTIGKAVEKIEKNSSSERMTEDEGEKK